MKNFITTQPYRSLSHHLFPVYPARTRSDKGSHFPVGRSDSRFATIEQVLEHYNEHIRQSPTLSSFLIDVSNQKGGKTLLLTTDEKRDIISFLSMLTDSTFITNPEFSNPHLTLKSQ